MLVYLQPIGQRICGVPLEPSLGHGGDLVLRLFSFGVFREVVKS